MPIIYIMRTAVQTLERSKGSCPVERLSAAEGVFLSVVVPAYNESARLARTFPDIIRYLGGLRKPFEVIVVDDGSTDGTGRTVLELAAGDPRVRVITLQTNSGKGAAVRAGMLAASGQYVIFTDADLSTPVETANSFLAQLSNGCDVVVGNRRMSRSRLEVRQPWPREFLGSIFTWLTRLILRSHVTDQTCGFKGFTRSAAREVFARQRIPGWAFDAEILHIAHGLKLTIHQEPVLWRDDAASKVKVAGACVRSLAGLFAIWYNSVTGKYR